MLSVKLSMTAPDGWDDFVAASPAGAFYQTTAFAKALELMGDTPLYLSAVAEDGSRVGQLLITESLLGKGQFTKPVLKPFAPLAVKLMPIWQWSYGPLFSRSVSSADITSFFVELTAIAKSRRIYAIRDVICPLHGESGQFSEELRAAGFVEKPWATFLVDLAPPVDELWQRLDKSGRKAVEKWETDGLKASIVSSREDLEAYLRLLSEFRSSAGLGLPPFYPSGTVWETLKGQNMDVFVVKKDAEIVSGMGVAFFNGVVTEVAVARSKTEFERKYYSQDLIKWEIIKWAKGRGMRIYDLAGVSPDPKTPKEKGIHQFKAKWGGGLKLYSTYSKTLSKMRKIAVTALRGTDKHED